MRTCHASVAVVVDGGIGPSVTQFRHIAQIHGVVGISINLIALIVEIIERRIVERSESYSENSADNRSCVAGVITVRWHRTRNRTTYGAIVAVRRWHGNAPVVIVNGAYRWCRVRRWAIAGPMAHSAMITAGIARLAVTGAVAVVVTAVAGTITAVAGTIVIAIRVARAVAAVARIARTLVAIRAAGTAAAVAWIARTLVAIRVAWAVAAIIFVTVVSAAVCAPRGGWTRNLSFGVGSENHSHSN